MASKDKSKTAKKNKENEGLELLPNSGKSSNSPRFTFTEFRTRSYSGGSHFFVDRRASPASWHYFESVQHTYPV